MPTTSLYESFGGTSFPFPATAVDDTALTLEPLDLLADSFVKLVKAAINSEIGPAWTKVTNSLGVGHPLYGTLPIQDTLQGHEPGQQIVEERRCQFPLLALHRVGTAKFGRFSNLRRSRTQEWNLHYILGPLDMAAAWKVTHVLHAIPALIDLVLERKGHPAYAGGALQFVGILAKIDLTGAEAGQATFASSEKTVFYATLMTLETVEVTRKVDGADEELTGAELVVNLVNPAEGTTIERFVEADTDPEWPGGT